MPKLGDRFLLVDIPDSSPDNFRNSNTFGNNYLSYAAAYHPYLSTTLNYVYDEDKVTINGLASQSEKLKAPAKSTFSWSSGDQGITVSYGGAAGDAPKVIITADTAVTDSEFDTGTTGTLAIRISAAKAPAAKDLISVWNNWKKSQGNNPNVFDMVSNGGGSAEITATTLQSLTKGSVSASVDLNADSNKADTQTLAGLKQSNTSLYNQIKSGLANQRVTLPPSPAIAGVYASVDRDRGVWKTPANVSLNAVIGPVSKISDTDQDILNIDPTAGKSINAIRSFTGKGTLVWGGRTLAGNDNEWRYISVRRLFINIEESTRKASAFAVFEPNDATTWLKVKAMIESYL
ncbi:MAG: phage tail sheath subtilisin-like domain-containing protein [Methylobacter sp.]|nr:phage tail sheath subtilisin-like domain-containing protein [Methylobacter sp.]